MTKPIHCGEHGYASATYVCQHVAAGTARLMYTANDPTGQDRWPDAWCERCEERLQVGGGQWDDVSEHFAHVQLICHYCYERRRATLARPGASRAEDPLLRFRYTCGACNLVHEGLREWAADAPFSYHDVDESTRRSAKLTPDLCSLVIDGSEHFFIRGCLDLPVRDTGRFWSFGIWTTLSERSFRRVVDTWKAPERDQEPPFFGWFATSLPRALYAETLGLKAHVYLRKPGERPIVVLEPTSHQLAVDQREGITVEHAHEMAALLLATTGGAPIAD